MTLPNSIAHDTQVDQNPWRLAWLFVISFLYLMPSVFSEFDGLYDEGIVLTGAERVLRGEIPYLDFWGIYAPGQFYTIALFFKAFGSSVLVERLYGAIVLAGLCLSMMLITQKVSSPRAAYVTWGLSLLYIAKFKMPGYSAMFPSLLAGLVGILFVLEWVRTKKWVYIVGCGLCIGISGLYRHDFGLYFGFSLVLFIGLKTENTLHSAIYPLLWFVASVLFVVVPVASYFLYHMEIELLVSNLFIIPSTIFPEYRALPYPELSANKLSYYLVPFTIVSTLFLSGITLIKEKSANNIYWYFFLLSLLGLLMLNQVRIRSDTSHLIPSALIVILLLPAICTHFYRGTVNRFVRTGRIVAVLLFLLSCGTQAYRLYSNLSEFNVDVAMSSKTGGLKVSNNLSEVLELIKNESSMDDSIYVGVINHDQFIKNATAIYFLAGNAYATKYHELHPGITTSREVQEDIINEIKTHQPKLVILTEEVSAEPNASSLDAKVDLLDSYIKLHYQKFVVLGEYTILKINPSV